MMEKAKRRRLIHHTLYSPLQKKSLHSIVKRELVLNFGYEDKLKIAEALSDEVVRIFEEFSREKDRLEPYEVLWLGIDRWDGPSCGKSIEMTKHKVIPLKLWTEEEIKQLASGKRRFSEIQEERIIRLAKDASERGVLLNPTDISLLVGKEVTGVRKVIREYEKRNDTSVPIRSRVWDMGSHQTHKKLIVKLYLRGMTTSEIARTTEHDVHNVDRYIEGFNRVRTLFERKFPVEEISFITGIPLKIVNEYVEILKEL